MAMPADIGIVDTMIGFPGRRFQNVRLHPRAAQRPFGEVRFPGRVHVQERAEGVVRTSKDPISVTLHEMDRFGIEIGLIGAGGEVATKALKDHPDRFVPMGDVDPNRGMDGIRDMVRQYETYGVRAFGAFNCGLQSAGRDLRRADVPDLRQVR